MLTFLKPGGCNSASDQPGDVIEEGERILWRWGQHCARLEALAPPGGICVSKDSL